MGSKITFWKQMRGLLSTIQAAAGLMPTANLGTGTASSASYLRGDQTYQLLSTMKVDLGLTTKVTLVATSDTFQIDTTPFATQTVNQQVWRNTSGAVVSSINANGQPTFGSGSFAVTSTFNATMWNGGQIGWTSGSSVNGTSTLETGLIRDGGAGLIAARVGTTPHDVRIYNTFTNSSNYERGHIGYQTNVFTIGSYALGTGTLRGINVGVSGNSIGFYGVTPIAKPTTGHAAATHGVGIGVNINTADTFDGYTIQQVVKALRDLGLLT